MQRLTKATKAALWAGVALAAVGVVARQHVLDRADPIYVNVFGESTGPLLPTADHSYPVYKLSVVKGGVHSLVDYIDAQNESQTVRDHYRDFSGAHLVYQGHRQIENDEAYYVSYKRGKSIYWTAKPITLHKGEAVIWMSEGFIRERCGNRLSAFPMQPTEDKAHQPKPEEFDVVEGGPDNRPSTTEQPDTHIPEGLPIVPNQDTPLTRLLNASLGQASPGGPVAAVAPVALAGLGALAAPAFFSTSGASGFAPLAAVAVPVAAAVTPEPQTFGNFLTALFVFALFAIVGRYQRANH